MNKKLKNKKELKQDLMDKNLIVNFTNTYPRENLNEIENTDWIDCSDISGTDMYCTDDAAKKIWDRLKNYSEKGIHFIDSGNYHYVTEFFVEKINYKFSLVLFDYHNDMQIPMIHTFTTCGEWARDVLEKNKNLEQLILIGPKQDTIDEICDLDEKFRKKLVCISLQQLEENTALKKLDEIKENTPLYISIDKDVLSKHYAKTNWNQGNMSVDLIKTILKKFLKNNDIIGADICGERSVYEPIPDFVEDRAINRKTNKVLYDFLTKFIKVSKKYERF